MALALLASYAVALTEVFNAPANKAVLNSELEPPEGDPNEGEGDPNEGEGDLNEVVVPMPKPQSIDNSRTVDIYLGYLGTDISVKAATVSVGELLSMAKTQVYSEFDGSYVYRTTACGVTINKILSAANIDKVPDAVSIGSGDTIDYSSFTQRFASYNNPQLYVGLSSGAPVANPVPDEDITDVDTTFAIWSGYYRYPAGQTEPSDIHEPAQENTLRLMIGQDSLLSGGTNRGGIKKITLLYSTLPTLEPIEDASYSLSEGASVLHPIAVSTDIDPRLSKAYVDDNYSFSATVSGIVDYETVIEGGSIHLKITAKQNTGATAQSPATTTVIADNTSFTLSHIDVSVYPVYTISYDSNLADASVTVENMAAAHTKNHGQSAAISDSVPTRSDMVFGGWNTQSDGSGTVYHPADSYNQNADLYLYAQWEVPSCQIHFDSNLAGLGADATRLTNFPKDTLAKVGEAVSLPTPKLYGYDFVCWSFDKELDMSKPFIMGSFTPEQDGSITIYAHWKPKMIKVTLDAGKGQLFITSSSQGVKVHTVEVQEGKVIDLYNYSNICKSGSTYTNGWQDSNGVKRATNYKHTVTAPITFTAQWPAPAPASSWSITYNGNGGSDKVTNVPAKQTKYRNSTLKISTMIPVRQGYTFVSWNTKKDGKGTKYQPGGNYTTNGGATLYAQWTEFEPTAAPTATPTQAPTPTPTPTPIPDAVLDDQTTVEEVVVDLIEVNVFEKTTPTPPNQSEQGGQDSQQPTPTPNPWNEREPEQDEEPEDSSNPTTYIIVGIVNAILIIAGGALAIVRFNMSL